MSVQALRTMPSSAVATPPATSDQLGDLRFRQLLSDAAWAELPPAVRRRFSKRLSQGRTVAYAGEVTEMSMSRVGFLLAQLARLIGGPLPTSRKAAGASLVAVTEDTRYGGQVWTRLYARQHGFPQVIHSAKRFAGPTGLEEHVGCGIGMTLGVSVAAGVLQFRSERYFLAIGGYRLTLPRLLTPGTLTVTHREIDPIRFAFTLDIEHPRLGRLLHQRAVYQEVGS